jgi:pimeloyl-ACP methyl ester carboxylesterase
VPGLLCSARLFVPQVEALWPLGPVTVADHRRDGEIGAVAKRILDNAPPRFALAGLSYGGYIAFEMMRQAPDRIAKLSLLDTSARPDIPDQSAGREKLIAMVRDGKFDEVVAMLAPRFIHPNRHKDEPLNAVLRAMVAETGPEVFILQQKSIMSRPDSRPLLAKIRCPTLVLVGDADELTPPDLAREIAGGIAGSRLVIVPDSGHLTTLERPTAVNAAMAEWLGA